MKVRCPNCKVDCEFREPNCLACGVPLDGKRRRIKVMGWLAAVVLVAAALLALG